MAYEQEKQVAVKAALSAAKLCEQVRGEAGARAIEKSDGTPVTVADFGAQAIICHTIAQVFPNDQVVGEEEGATLLAPEMRGTLDEVTAYVKSSVSDASHETVISWINRGNGEIGPRYWTIDPIDGTKGFLRGDQYAVAVALIEEAEVKVGILACPPLPVHPGDYEGEKGVIFAAVRGQGAIMFPMKGGPHSPIRVAGVGQNPHIPFTESVESDYVDHAQQRAVANAIGVQTPSLRVDGQGKYGIVARGEADLYLRFPSSKSMAYLEKIWDHAAGAIIVEEAGGRVSDMHGRPLDFSRGRSMEGNQGILAGHISDHDKALEALKLTIW